MRNYPLSRGQSEERYKRLGQLYAGNQHQYMDACDLVDGIMWFVDLPASETGGRGMLFSARFFT